MLNKKKKKRKKETMLCIRACCKHTNSVAFAPAIRKTCAERRAHACLLVTALKRFARFMARSNERRFDHQITQSFRTKFAGDRSPTLPHRLLVWVNRAFGSHSKVWSWSLDSSATRIDRASDCRRGRVKKKKEESNALCSWTGSAT